jgi:cytochrome P450
MPDLSADSNYWTGPHHLAQALLGMWFAAVHQPWMNLDFILQQLCIHPKWQDILFEEIQNLEGLDYHKLQGLPLLDAFMKETVRLNPLDTSE